jgi:AraC family transcriptional regulator
MKQLQTGEFHGQTNNILQLEGVVLTDTEYTHDRVDWHYHENAYFTFILQGNVLEINKKETYHCAGGSLLFHHSQDPHYNIKPAGFTRGFHVELVESWFKHFSLDSSSLQGSLQVSNIDVRLLFYRIFREAKRNDHFSSLEVQALLIQVFDKMLPGEKTENDKKPAWVPKLKEVLHDNLYENYSLDFLSQYLGLHPVHLSRYFPRYFHCSLGEYMRKLRVEKSLSLMPDKKQSLAAIAYDCGFADQSHFSRCFREFTGLTPMAYRRVLLS